MKKFQTTHRLIEFCDEEDEMNLLESVMTLDEFLESKATSSGLKVEKGGLFSGIDSWKICSEDDSIVIDLVQEDSESSLFFAPTKLGLCIAKSIKIFLGGRIDRVCCGEVESISPKLAKQIRSFLDEN